MNLIHALVRLPKCHINKFIFSKLSVYMFCVVLCNHIITTWSPYLDTVICLYFVRSRHNIYTLHICNVKKMALLLIAGYLTYIMPVSNLATSYCNGSHIDSVRCFTVFSDLYFTLTLWLWHEFYHNPLSYCFMVD